MPRREGEVLRLGTAIENSKGRANRPRRRPRGMGSGAHTRSGPKTPALKNGVLPAASGVALGLEHREVHRLAGATAGPEDELKGLEIVLTGAERGVDDRAALRVA